MNSIYYPKYEYISDIEAFKSNNSYYDNIMTDKFTSPGYYVVDRWNRDNPYETYVCIRSIEEEIIGLERDINIAKEYLIKNKEINNNGMC